MKGWTWVWLVCATLAAPPVAAAELPVVLAPGYCGQREAGALGPYFIGLRRALEQAGVEVYELAPPPIASSRERGRALLRQVDEVRARAAAQQVIVIAHSQGGVDVRVALAEDDQERIAAVATFSSPHHGTGVADTALRWPRALVTGALSTLGVGWQLAQGEAVTPPDALGSLEDLSTAGMTEMAVALGEPRVPFFSIASISGPDVDNACAGGAWSKPHVEDELHPVLVFGRAMIHAAAGDVSDDGVVPTKSMRYGTFLGCVAADHADVLSWDSTSAFPAHAFIIELWRGLRDVAKSGDERAMDGHVLRLAALARATPYLDERVRPRTVRTAARSR